MKIISAVHSNISDKEQGIISMMTMKTNAHEKSLEYF